MEVIYSTGTNLTLEFERRKLVDMAMVLGLDHPRVIEQSQKLDKLINQAMKGGR